MMQMNRNQLCELLNPMSTDEIKLWMRRRCNKDILQGVWDTEYPTLKLKNMGEAAYVFKFNVSPLCDIGQHKNFKQFPIGYFTKCNASQCQCFFEMRSAIMIESSKKIDLTVRQERYTATMLEKYGVTNSFLLADHQEKTKDTLRNKYGVESIELIPGVKEKKKQTSIKNYGVDHPKKSQEVVERTKITSLEKYGYTCSLQHPDIRKKADETMLDRYGVTNYFSLPENQKAINDDRKNRLGYSNVGQRFLSAETLAILSDKEQFTTAVTGLSYAAAAIKLDTSEYTISNYAKQYDVCSLMSIGQGSVVQDEIISWLRGIGVNVERNTRKIIPPKEIDIFLPEYNLGIEYNGIYHHTEISGKRDKHYHYNKYAACKALGIELIQICSTVYREKPEIIRGIILSKLSMTKKIYARNCIIRQVSSQDTIDFLSKTHIMESTTTGAIRLGLYSKQTDELLQVMTFGKPRTHVDAEYEIVRIATKVGTTVVGGLSKLFSHFVKNTNPQSVISYSDLRYFTGESLGNLGFTLESESRPGYWYTNYHKIYHRVNYQKYKLVEQGFDPALSEWEIMSSRGFDRLWDCGQAKWSWKKYIKEGI